MECSNKGDCDRTTGECKCFDGYEGVACQRASCPNSCSGHGVCKSAKQLAAADHGNIYKLWDKLSTMGCECDAGFSGPDCSEKLCKHGVDPLYLDDIATIKYPVWNFATLHNDITSTNAFHDSQDGTGYWAIRFFDSHGEDWLTSPIVAGATCNQVMKELYSLPNNVIPWGSLRCTRISNVGSGGVAQSATTWNEKNGIGDASASSSDLGQDDGHGSLINGATPNPDDDADMDKIAGSGNPRAYFIRPNMAIWESNFANNENGEWSDELWGLPSGTMTSSAKAGAAHAVTDVNTKVKGYIYRIQFWGNPGNLREPEIELNLDGKRPSLQAGVATLETLSIATTPDYKSVTSRVITKVWTDGQQGEDNDYFADHCDGVQVKIQYSETGGNSNPANAAYEPSGVSQLSLINSAKTASLLKQCLGDADFDTTNNVDLSDWDIGSVYYPHLIKLVRSVTTVTDGGFYAAVYFDSPNFKLVNPFYPPDEIDTDLYEVYTTRGTLALTSIYTEAIFGFASKYIFTSRAAGDALNIASPNGIFDGDLSCEVNRVELEGAGAPATPYWRLGTTEAGNPNPGTVGFASRFPGRWTLSLGTVPSYQAASSSAYTLTALAQSTPYYVEHCMNKSDIFTILNWATKTSNPPKINLYRAQRIFRNDYTKAYSQVSGHIAGAPAAGGVTTAGVDHHAHWMTRVITTDISTNFASGVSTPEDVEDLTNTMAGFRIYKFFPARESTYNYVAPCSNRGNCDLATGLCQCFPGYTSDACSEQSSLAI